MCRLFTIILLLACSLTPAAGASVFTAGDAKNLWVVRANPHGEFTILHRGKDAPPDTIYKALQSSGRPLAIAAHNSQLYIVYGDRSVQSMTFTQPEAYMPSLRVTQLPPLEHAGEVVGLIAGRSGPFVLLQRDRTTNNNPASLKPEADQDTGDAPDEAVETDQPVEADASPFMLLSTQRGRWQTLDVPSRIDPDQFIQLVMVSPKQDRLAILSETRPPSGLITDVWDGRTWTRQKYLLKLSSLARGVGVQDDLAVVAPLAGAKSRQLNAFYLRQESVAPLGVFKPIQPGEPWHLSGYNNKITVVINDAEGQLHWAQQGIEPNAPRTAEPTPLNETAPSIAPDPITLVFIAAIVIGMLFLFATARRDPGAGVPHLPPHLRPMAATRFIAAAIDMAPAVVIAMIVFKLRNPLDMLINWPGTTTDWQLVLPAAVAITIFVTHTAVCELLFAATLGKALMGLRVTNLYGGPPHLWQVLARNGFKIIELLAPLLLVLPLLSMHNQRLGDLVARTLVVGHTSSFEED